MEVLIGEANRESYVTVLSLLHPLYYMALWRALKICLGKPSPKESATVNSWIPLELTGG